MILFFGTNSLFFKILFIVQICFYLLAVIAAFILPRNRFKILKLPYYFTFMNISVMLGFFRFLRGNQSAIWEKANRAQPTFTTK
jgi:hypothetical protein